MDQKLDADAETLEAEDQPERNGGRYVCPNVGADHNEDNEQNDGTNHPDYAGRP